MVVEAHERVVGVTDEVTDLHWPADAARRAELAGEGQPRLLIVAEGEEPPITADPLEDWVRPSADALEFYMRRDRLRRRAAARAPASIDADGLLHRGDRWVALPPGELAALTALMTEPGHMVARADLADALGMDAAEVDERTRALDNVVRRVRKRIAPLGMAVCAVRGTGFLLEIGELPF
jgi:Transcriptional regulatory protein, C terminal